MLKMTDLIELSRNDQFTEQNHEVCLFICVKGIDLFCPHFVSQKILALTKLRKSLKLFLNMIHKSLMLIRIFNLVPINLYVIKLPLKLKLESKA